MLFNTLSEIQLKCDLKFSDEDLICSELIVGIFNNQLNNYHDLSNPKLYGYRGLYYGTIEHNYEEMKRYYLMAINLGCRVAMYNLGSYYHNIELDYNETKRCYLMAIHLGCRDAM